MVCISFIIAFHQYFNVEDSIFEMKMNDDQAQMMHAKSQILHEKETKVIRNISGDSKRSKVRCFIL